VGLPEQGSISCNFVVAHLVQVLSHGVAATAPITRNGVVDHEGQDIARHHPRAVVFAQRIVTVPVEDCIERCLPIPQQDPGEIPAWIPRLGSAKVNHAAGRPGACSKHMSTFSVAVQEPSVRPGVEHPCVVVVPSFQALRSLKADVAGLDEVLDAFGAGGAYTWAPSVAFPAWVAVAAADERAKAIKPNLVHSAHHTLRHDLRALTPLKWQHINPYGTFLLDMQHRLHLDLVA